MRRMVASRRAVPPVAVSLARPAERSIAASRIASRVTMPRAVPSNATPDSRLPWRSAMSACTRHAGASMPFAAILPSSAPAGNAPYAEGSNRARGRVELERALAFERDAAASGDLALARARAKPLDVDGLPGDDRAEIQRDSAGERPVGDVAANSLLAAAEIGIDASRRDASRAASA